MYNIVSLDFDFESRNNVERPIWRNGDRRRSPRITSKIDDDTKQKGGGSSPSTKSRTKIKRKFNQIDIMESAKDGTKQHSEDQLTTCGEPNMKLPEKRILELILDTLQRRDVHEIFAEPVDPEEVEDYYDIIEKPMDFGTMRAKLHEGLYQNLQQFEHDVFLIPKNAMHFNSSSSIYFRQARGIYEVAQKLFEVLKSDPEHFELEFSREKRRSITRAMGKTKSIDPSMGTIDQPQKYCNSGQLVSRKTQGRQGLYVGASSINKKYSHLCYGGGKNGKFESCEADRRSTYAFWRPSFNNVFSSVDAEMFTEPKQLYLINQPDINYNESLMLFVKDLGPIAQTIAKKKLQQWPQNPCNEASVLRTQERNSVFSTAIGKIPSWRNPDTLLGSSSYTAVNKKPKPLCDPIGDGAREGALSTKKIQQRGKVIPENKAEEMKPAKKDNHCIKNQRIAVDPKEIKKCNAGYKNLVSLEKKKVSSGNRSIEGKAVDARRSEDNMLPIVLALEHPRLDNGCDQLKPREKKNLNDQSSAVWPSNHKQHFGFLNSQAPAATAANDGVKKTLPPSGFSFAAPLLNQAHLTNNQRSGHFQAGLGLDGFSKLRFQGAMDNNRGWQEETSTSSRPFVRDDFKNQLLWPPRNPPATNFVPNFPPNWRGFALNGNSF